ncbi:MAG TPA: hypothetical protein VNZ94_01415 [Xanthobacteraceae bacterium]|nr:hypothetical protein [Xanthobacteraceae bacterium]
MNRLRVLPWLMWQQNSDFGQILLFYRVLRGRAAAIAAMVSGLFPAPAGNGGAGSALPSIHIARGLYARSA